MNIIRRITNEKGTRVRVLRTNEIGTIAEKQLIRKGREMKIYCNVKLDNKPEQDTWYYADQLIDTIVKADVSIRATDRSTATFSVEFDTDIKSISLDHIRSISENKNIPIDKSLATWITVWLFRGIRETLKEAYGGDPVVNYEKW